MAAQATAPNDPKALRKQLMTLVGALVMGQLMFLLASSAMEGPIIEDVNDWSVVRLIAPLFALATIALGMLFFRRSVEKMAMETETAARISQYRLAFLKRVAMIYVGGFASLLAYFFSHDAYFLLIVFPMLALQVFLGLKASDAPQVAPLFETR